ncbi:MAG TPA: hypothetical protein GXX14_04660 [Clostridiaceae bacterium]|nr:hypothetical protein [Clostridiaceae bacterium]
MAWINPKIDWITNPVKPRSNDFNRIEGNILSLKQEIEAKKGLLVDAINTKQELVTIESSYQEMADAINIINQNPRMASGTAAFSLVEPISGEGTAARAEKARFIVSGLPFRPGRIFARCRLNVRIDNSTFPDPPYSSENWVDYRFGVVNNVLTTPTAAGSYFVVSGGMGFISISTAGISIDVSIQDDGFILTVTATQPNTIRQLQPRSNPSENIQYWYAYEEEG